VVLLNPHDPPRRTAAHVDFTQASFLLYDSACAGTVESCVSSQRTWSFQELESASGQYDVASAAAPKATDAALILFTSGTTGSPKAVVQSHYAVSHNAWSVAKHHRIRPSTRIVPITGTNSASTRTGTFWRPPLPGWDIHSIAMFSTR